MQASKLFSIGAGEMDPWLRALVALAEEPRFSSQYPHGNSQLFINSVPRDPIPSFDLHRQQECVWFTHM